jgi:hypothetical protein
MAPIRGKLVAIASTLYLHQDTDPLYRAAAHENVCGVVKWCADTARFASQLSGLVRRAGGDPDAWYANVDVVLSTNNVSFAREQCGQPSVLIERMTDDIVELANRFPLEAFNRTARRAEAIAAGKRLHIVTYEFDRALITKWWLVGLTRYEAILMIDYDIDLFEVGRTSPLGMDAYLLDAARAWIEELPRFRSSKARLLGTPDRESPTNAGMLWMKPSRGYYQEGIALLKSFNFSIDLGFNCSGRPRELMPPRFAADPAVASSRMMALNTWNVVAGSSDQGLFTLIFIMRYGAFATTRRKQYAVHHFWSGAKPWLRLPSCLPYFHALGMLDAPGTGDSLGPPPGLIPLPREERGFCRRLLYRKAALLRVSSAKRWRCRGANFQVF